MSFTDAPVPNNPDAQFAAYRSGVEERVSRLENSNLSLPIPMQCKPGSTSTAYLSTVNSLSSPIFSYIFVARHAYYDCIEVEADFSAVSGSTGSARLRNVDTGQQTDLTTISAGTNIRIKWHWLHGVDTNIGAGHIPLRIGIYFHRSGGAVGAITSAYPQMANLIPAEVAPEANTNGGAIVT